MQSSNSTTILQPPETGHEKINNNNGGGGVSSPPRNTQTRLPKSSAFERIHSPHSILSPVAEVPRRNSLSEMTFEDAKSTLLSTTGGVLIPTATDSTWHSIPLAFAMLPAIAGAIFTNGEGLTTDILLLSLVAIFLHWFVKFPWEWYQNSKQLSRDIEASNALRDEEEAMMESSALPENAPNEARKPQLDPIELRRRREATEELQLNETYALICCFLGPLLGGWLLYAIRSQLSRPSGGLISNFNLNVFVLAAELRPCAEVVMLIRDRNAYLQSVAFRAPVSKVEVLEAKMEALQTEVRELSFLTTKAIERDADVDALNRAVRRYEKKDALQSLQTEARLIEIDNRLNDVLTLAAAATIRQRQQTVSVMLFDWFCSILVIPFGIAWKVVGLPKKVVQKVSELGASGLKASAPRLLLKQGSQAPGRRKDKTRLPSSSKGALKGKAAKI